MREDEKEYFKKIFYENVKEILSDFKRDFCFLKLEAEQSGTLKNIHRHAHSIKGLSATMKLDGICSISEKLEDMIKKIIDGTLDLNEDTLLEIKSGFDRIEKLLGNG